MNVAVTHASMEHDVSIVPMNSSVIVLMDMLELHVIVSIEIDGMT